MATTTNYGWTTPDDTALVKDGAAAIRTLGTSADTTVKNLNPETTLGDIAYRSSTSNVNTRLGIGTAGQILTVASGVPSWATPASGGMTLISTTTLTGGQIDLTSIPQTHINLRMVIRNFKPANDGEYLELIFQDYNATNRQRLSTDTTNADNLAMNDYRSKISSGQDDTSADLSLITIDFPDYTNTTTAKVGYSTAVTNNATTAANINVRYQTLFYNQTTAITKLTLFPSSGNFTSGTVLLYGVK